jgi:hypothetical protein
MKKCKHCKKPFTPRFSTLERTCREYQCLVLEAMSKVQEMASEKAKKSKERLKVMKSDLETVQSLTKKAQAVFNRFIRLRDADKPCVSCGKNLAKKYDAGHYFSSGGHKAVTFDERNCHGQCVYCNQHLHGNLLNYQIGIVERIGEELFELTELAHTTRKFTKQELLEIIEIYKQKCKGISK